MAELFELEEEVIRMSSDVKDKYERELAATYTGQNSVPIVLCGDFNNSPESPVYEYMERSFMQKPNVEGVSEAFRSAYAFYKSNALVSAREQSAEALQSFGVEEGSEGDLRRDPDAGDVDLEVAGSQQRAGERLVAADRGDAAGRPEGVPEPAAAHVSDRSAVPVDRFVADEVVVG